MTSSGSPLFHSPVHIDQSHVSVLPLHNSRINSLKHSRGQDCISSQNICEIHVFLKAETQQC